MRLAIDATNIGPGGGITGLGYYLKEWMKMGRPEEIILWASRPGVLSMVESLGGNIRIEPFMVGKSSPVRFLAGQVILPRLIEKKRPDVLMSTLRMLHHCKVPQLVHHRNLLWQIYETFPQQLKHGIPLRLAFKNARKRREYYYALKHSAVNAYISQYMCDLASEQYAPSKPRNFAVRNGGLQSPYTDEEKLALISKERPATIVAVQSDGVHKQSDKLLYMMRCLLDKAPAVNWKLILVGTIYEENKFNALSDSLGVTSHVEKTGYLKPQQVYELFKTALCHVFPSKVEGFGNSPLEAMAMGCPVVASDCTAIPEVVGDAGILVAPENAEGFADGVLKIHDDAKLRGEFIARGFEQIKSFSWENSAKRMLELFNMVAGK